MAQGVYGTKIPASITSEDIDIYYNFRGNRSDDSANSTAFKQLDSNLLNQSFLETNGIYDNQLEGMYNLKLPLQYFNQKGYYTVYIKPKEMPTTILDVGVLVTYPDVKGIIIDSSTIQNAQLQSLLKTNNGLVGYRIIYFTDKGERLPYCRLITSNNTCEAVVQNLSETNSNSIRYRYNENSSLIFITLTPSIAPSHKSNAEPFIGNKMQRIAIVNTKFEPIMLDIEMVDHDMDTISNMLEGSQLRDLDNGLITTFNDNGEIYNQSEHYSIKDSYTQDPIYEVKRNKKNSIDFTQTLEGK